MVLQLFEIYRKDNKKGFWKGINQNANNNITTTDDDSIDNEFANVLDEEVIQFINIIIIIIIIILFIMLITRVMKQCN